MLGMIPPARVTEKIFEELCIPFPVQNGAVVDMGTTLIPFSNLSTKDHLPLSDVCSTLSLLSPVSSSILRVPLIGCELVGHSIRLSSVLFLGGGVSPSGGLQSACVHSQSLKHFDGVVLLAVGATAAFHLRKLLRIITGLSGGSLKWGVIGAVCLLAYGLPRALPYLRFFCIFRVSSVHRIPDEPDAPVCVELCVHPGTATHSARVLDCAIPLRHGNTSRLSGGGRNSRNGV